MDPTRRPRHGERRAGAAALVGGWVPNDLAYGWTIAHENRKTGACSGTSTLAPQGYRLVGCRVHGSALSFAIVKGRYRITVKATLEHGELVGEATANGGTDANSPDSFRATLREG
jgi:hypothetical protein